MELNDQSNLSDLFLGRLRESPDTPAYRQFYDAQGRTSAAEGKVPGAAGQWIDMTWGEVGREVGRWQAAFRHQGLTPGDRVALCLHNRIEWVVFDQAAIGLGLITVPLYFDDRPDNMAWCLSDAGVRLLLLEDSGMWPALKGGAMNLELAVCLDNKAPVGDDKAVNFTDWLPPEGDRPARSAAKAEELVTIVYTSGTTGRPKGVMLSHRNILSNVMAAFKAFPAYPADRFLSFLPLSHMFERTTAYYLGILGGAQTVYARGITQLAEDILQQQPTILISVPRIFERIYVKMQETMSPGSPKRRLFDKAVDVGWKRFKGQLSWREKLLWPLLRLLVAKKLHRKLGGRIRLIIVGGAAFAPEHARVFIGLGLPIIQGYGLTETSPVLSANRLNDNDPTSVGRPLEGIELKCDERRELLARGPNIMLGYWNNPKATAEAIDPDGWFHTGDIVRIRDGRVYITGRVKEIIVLSNGEKVPPVDAEQEILLDTAIEQAMVLGEGRAKLGLLVVSKIENEEELCVRANKRLHKFPGYAKICHIARVAGPWTVENGLLTPTLKLKRKKIEERYVNEIESMYRREDICQRRGR
jgi:long-chain acyl-CoA synthetase